MIKYIGVFVLALGLGCGPSAEPQEEEPVLPTVKISCDVPVDRNRCLVTVRNATNVEAYHNDWLAWYDYDIPSTESFQFYPDSPPNGVFRVEACSDYGCTIESVELPAG